jgi:hypothetical protein
MTRTARGNANPWGGMICGARTRLTGIELGPFLTQCPHNHVSTGGHFVLKLGPGIQQDGLAPGGGYGLNPNLCIVCVRV